MIGRIIVFQKAVSGTQVFFFSFHLFFPILYLYSIIFMYVCVYLAALGLICGMQDLPFLLWRVGSSVASCGFLVGHMGSSSLTRDRTCESCLGNTESATGPPEKSLEPQVSEERYLEKLHFCLFPVWRYYVRGYWQKWFQGFKTSAHWLKGLKNLFFFKLWSHNTMK